MENNDIGTKADLVNYRLLAAREDIVNAKVLLDAGGYKAANNRAYYAIFHGINAIHALQEKSYRRHKDAVANFNKDYVKTGIFPKTLGREIGKAEEIRHASDYDDFYIATREEAEKQIETAEEFIQLAEKYCLNQLKKQE